jgi:hypothetical protein
MSRLILKIMSSKNNESIYCHSDDTDCAVFQKSALILPVMPDLIRHPVAEQSEGVQFSIFVNQLEHGIYPTVTRPPGIEAFLPISSLISLKYWLVTGIFNRVHPSDLIILIAALVLKRGFCSWVC